MYTECILYISKMHHPNASLDHGQSLSNMQPKNPLRDINVVRIIRKISPKTHPHLSKVFQLRTHEPEEIFLSPTLQTAPDQAGHAYPRSVCSDNHPFPALVPPAPPPHQPCLLSSPLQFRLLSCATQQVLARIPAYDIASRTTR